MKCITFSTSYDVFGKYLKLKAFKAFKKPFETPQRSVKIKI